MIKEALIGTGKNSWEIFKEGWRGWRSGYSVLFLAIDKALDPIKRQRKIWNEMASKMDYSTYTLLEQRIPFFIKVGNRPSFFAY